MTEPQTSPTGIRISAQLPQVGKVSTRPLVIVLSVAGILLLLIGYGLYRRSLAPPASASASHEVYPNNSGSAQMFTEEFKRGHRTQGAATPPVSTSTPTTAAPPIPDLSRVPPPTSVLTSTAANATYTERPQSARDIAYQQEQDAITTPLTDNEQTNPAGFDTSSGPVSGLSAPPIPPVSPTEPKGKEPFVLIAQREPAPAGNVLAAGTWIHASFEERVVSEIPGQLVARIDEPVWGATQTILIPAGAKLLGSYSSRIAVGAGRMIQVWDRIVFPDNSSIALTDLGSYDAQGSAGIQDKLNTHLGKLIRDAAITTIFAAGIAVTQRQNTSLLQTPSVSTTIGQSVGQELGSLVNQSARLNFNHEPVGEVRPGFGFHVLVSRPLIFQ